MLEGNLRRAFPAAKPRSAVRRQADCFRRDLSALPARRRGLPARGACLLSRERQHEKGKKRVGDPGYGE